MNAFELRHGSSWLSPQGDVYPIEGFHEEWLREHEDLAEGSRNVCELVLRKRWISVSLFAEGYVELPGRLNLVGARGGLRFIDDSLATNVLPTLAALRSFPDERLALLLGGYDRGIDYSELLGVLAERHAPTLVVGLPDSGARLVAELDAAGGAAETTTAGSVE